LTFVKTYISGKVTTFVKVILLPGTTKPWDGIEVYSYELANQFSKMGIEVTGIRISLENKINEVNPNFKVIDVKTPNLKYSAYHIRVVMAYLKKYNLLREADLVHAVGGYYLGVRPFPLKKVVTIIGASSLREKSPMKKIIRRAYSSILYRGASGYIFPNQFIKQEVNRYLKTKRSKVIPIGIDYKSLQVNESKEQIREKLGLEKDSLIILYLGQLVNGKRLPETLRAFSLVSKEIPKARLVMVSWGYLKDDLESLARELNILEKVMFVPPVKYEDRKYYYKAADVFVMLGDSFGDGGISTAVMDAIGSGLPVIVSKLSPNVEVVKNGWNGFAVEPSNANEVKDAILKSAYDSNLGRNSLELAKKFSWREIAIQTLEFYKQLLGEQNNPVQYSSVL